MSEVDWAALSAPFTEIKYRVGATSQKRGPDGKYPQGTRGQMMAYVDARHVMDRLDTVVGPGNWSDQYRVIDLGDGVVECALTVAGVLKCDVGYKNDARDDASKEPLKAAYSDAFKRAAVKFGIGRFLYDMESTWVEIDPWGKPLQNPRQAMPQAQAIPQRAQPRPAAQPAPPAPAPASPLIDAAVAERAKWMAQQPVCPDPIGPEDALDVVKWRSEMFRVLEDWPWHDDALTPAHARMKKLGDVLVAKAGGSEAASTFLEWLFDVPRLKELKEPQVVLLERFVQGENVEPFLKVFMEMVNA